MPWASVPGSNYEAKATYLGDKFASAVAATGRPMVLDINDGRGSRNHDYDWTWAPAIAQEWRVTCDINPSYASMYTNVFGKRCGPWDLELWRYAHPGGWNDAGMLEIGNKGMGTRVDRTEFSLWAIEAAPLIAGNDLRAMTPTVRSILTNRRIIAVDQDPLGRQGHAIQRWHGHWVLIKPLTGARKAIVLFNASSVWTSIYTNAERVGLPAAPYYRVHNLWSGHWTRTKGGMRLRIPPHGVKMFVMAAG